MDEDDSPFCIDVTDQYRRLPVDVPSLGKVIGQTLRRFGCQRARIDVALVDDARIERLNETYLRHPGPTDCITFSLADRDSDGIDGQIVISCETAQREAAARGHDAVSEVLLYAVHGTLHLLGWDDAAPEEARRMHTVEDQVLSGCGVGPIYHSSPA
ncbi:MAG: rRNA maturation RNase YbeY [Phycisphaerae bacterium]